MTKKELTGRGARVACVAAASLMLFACRSAEDRTAFEGTTRMEYPQTSRSDQTDVFFGTTVADPYRWLEDPNTPEARAWIEAQNAVTETYLASIPQRAAIRDRLTALWNFERTMPPIKRGGTYLVNRNDGLQNQNVIYAASSLAAEPRVLLDPNQLSKDGTIALSGMNLSPDGKLLAYGITDGGSDWNTWRVRDVATGRDLADTVAWVKFSNASWTHDSAGFYYSRYDAPKPGEALQEANFGHQVWFHRIGTGQEQDLLVFKRSDEKEWNFDAEVTEDGRYLVIKVEKGTQRQNDVFVKDLMTDGPIVELLTGFRAGYDFLGNVGSRFWFMTDGDAPRGRIISLDSSGATRGPVEIVPQAKATLTSARFAGGRIVADYLDDAHSVLKVFELDGRAVGEIPLPGLGTVDLVSSSADDPDVFFRYTSFTDAGAVFRYDVASGKTSLYRAPKVAFDAGDYVTTQVFATSRDGTKVPMFLSHKKGLAPNGNAPVLLYGYGGFNIPLTPSFSVTALVWMEMGGVYAVANLRGGGEYGEAWHEAGTKLRKQNVFDDFIACATSLITTGWTRAGRIAISGASNGGLLVGACLVQRPDLFGACLPAVGVLDMLRFHKFTIGWAWTSDYGSPDDPTEFQALYAYSPYHQLKAGAKYPATLITTGDHDDRVVPAHSFKFGAALQHAQAGSAPTLLRIETRAGHGAGKPTRMRIDEAADQLTFVVRNLGM